ncbi:MAG: heat-inducible transcription repressor HrcA [Ruminococcaceae bacterium]|nr:heat-inducible transcription repressor HrcA [Oscillospiraceae bacterium]
MDINERKKKILHSIIHEYIKSAEPIGSRHVAKSLDMGLSSATIRNEMADLEEMGYLEQPHTSAGRIPSDKGYRLYVDSLMNDSELTVNNLAMLGNVLELRLGQIDKIIKRASVLLSELTNYTAVLTTPEMKCGAIKTIELIPVDASSALIILVTNEGVMKNRRVLLPSGVDAAFLQRFSALLKEKLSGLTLEEISAATISEIRRAMQTHFELLFPVLDFIADIIDDVRTETEVYTSGETNIFNHPEYSDIKRAKEFLDFLNDKNSVMKILNAPEEKKEDVQESGGITVKIGSENDLDIMRKSSVITANYYIGDKAVGKVGIIGPTRMDYSHTIAKIKGISAILNRMLYELYVDDE